PNRSGARPLRLARPSAVPRRRAAHGAVPRGGVDARARDAPLLPRRLRHHPRWRRRRLRAVPRPVRRHQGARMTDLWQPHYELRDHEIVDYQYWELPGSGIQFRGPAVDFDDPSPYFTCIGAAQTFGCFVPEPYPGILGAQ